MLKLSLKQGEYLDIGPDIRIIFSGGSSNNVHLLIDAPREMAIKRSNSGKEKKASPYYKEAGLSDSAKAQIKEIIMREKRNGTSGY